MGVWACTGDVGVYMGVYMAGGWVWECITTYMYLAM